MVLPFVIERNILYTCFVILVANDLIDETKEPLTVKKPSHDEKPAFGEAPPLQVEEPVLIEDLSEVLIEETSRISSNNHDPDISLQAFFQSNSIEGPFSSIDICNLHDDGHPCIIITCENIKFNYQCQKHQQNTAFMFTV